MKKRRLKKRWLILGFLAAIFLWEPVYSFFDYSMTGYIRWVAYPDSEFVVDTSEQVRAYFKGMESVEDITRHLEGEGFKKYKDHLPEKGSDIKYDREVAFMKSRSFGIGVEDYRISLHIKGGKITNISSSKRRVFL